MYVTSFYMFNDESSGFDIFCYHPSKIMDMRCTHKITMPFYQSSRKIKCQIRIKKV